MARNVFIRKTHEEITSLTKGDLLKLAPEEIDSNSKVTKEQLNSFTRNEVIKLNSILKYDFPKEKTHQLVVEALRDYIADRTFEDNSPKALCDLMNSERVDEQGLPISPLWYELVANIPGTENVCTVELIEEALK